MNGSQGYTWGTLEDHFISAPGSTLLCSLFLELHLSPMFAWQ